MQLWYCSVPMSSALRSAHNAGAPHPPNTCTVTDTMPCWEPRSSAGISQLCKGKPVFSACALQECTCYCVSAAWNTFYCLKHSHFHCGKIYISIYYQYFFIKHAQIIFNLQIFTVCWKYLVLMSLSFFLRKNYNVLLWLFHPHLFLKITCYN